jgi:hypothetical protein
MWKLTLGYSNMLSFAISLPIAIKSPYLGQPCCYWLSKSTMCHKYTWNLEPFPSKTFILTTIGHLPPLPLFIPNKMMRNKRWYRISDQNIHVYMYTALKIQIQTKKQATDSHYKPKLKIYLKHNNLSSDSLKVTITGVITFRELLKCVLPSHSSQIA